MEHICSSCSLGEGSANLLWLDQRLRTNSRHSTERLADVHVDASTPSSERSDKREMSDGSDVGEMVGMDA